MPSYISLACGKENKNYLLQDALARVRDKLFAPSIKRTDKFQVTPTIPSDAVPIKLNDRAGRFSKLADPSKLVLTRYPLPWLTSFCKRDRIFLFKPGNLNGVFRD